MEDLTLTRFVLRLHLGEGRQHLPAYLGSTFRGVFASAYRGLVCVTNQPTCEDCLLLTRCSYPYIFETAPPPHTTALLQQQRFHAAPRPYVLQPPLTYRGEEQLEIGLVLIGKASQFLPYFLYVLQQLGEQGIGRAQVPYRVLTVTDGSQDNGPVVFHPDTQQIFDHFATVRLSQLTQPTDDHVTTATVEFLTPLRIKKHGAYGVTEQQLEFPQLMDLLLGRMEALAFFHCDTPWDRNDRLRHAAREVHVVARHLTFHPLERYSNRQRKTLPLHGYVGTLTVTGPLTPFLPLLRLGEYLHVGAGTAFGLGRYRLAVTS
jgi:CRISPR-associated endoribonuclease Cas6